MNTYEYITTGKESKTVSANTPEEAMKIAPNIASDSGVKLVTQAPIQSPTQQPTQTPQMGTVSSLVPQGNSPAVQTSEPARNAETQTKIDQTKIAQDQEAQIADLERQAKIKTLKEQLVPANAPAPLSLAESFKQLREQSGVSNLETNLTLINNNKLKLQQELAQFKRTEPYTGVSTGFATGRMSERQQELQKELDSLNTESALLTDQINTKNDYINAVMKLTQTDYEAATKKFNEDFTKNYQAQELYSTQEDKNVSMATAYLTSMKNMLSETGKKWSDLDPSTQATIKSKELQAGLPVGATQALFENSDDQVLKIEKSAQGEGYEVLRKGKNGLYVQQLSSTPQGTVSTDKVIQSQSGQMYDLSTYATDPNHAAAIQKILNKIGKLETPQDITNYIKSVDPNSPITADMIMQASQKYGVGWEELIALMQQESQLGTAGVGSKTNNPGNVGNEDSGKTTKLNSWQDGVNAAAEQLAKRKTDLSTIDQEYIFGDLLKTLSPQGAQAFNSYNETDKLNVMQLIQGDALSTDIAKGIGGAKYAQKLLGLAKKVDPNFSENVNKQRYAFKTKWNDPNGKTASIRTGVNTALYHLARLKELTDQLSSNGSFQKANSIKNWIAENINTPGLSDVIGQFQDTVDLLSTEIARAYKGGVPDQLEINRQIDSINQNKPTNVISSIITNKGNLMSGLIINAAKEYEKVMGKFPEDPVVNEDSLIELQNKGVDISSIVNKLESQGYKFEKIDVDPTKQSVGSEFYYRGQKIKKVGENNYQIVQ